MWEQGSQRHGLQFPNFLIPPPAHQAGILDHFLEGMGDSDLGEPDQ